MNVDIIAGTGNAMTSYATTVWATPDLRQAHVAAVDLPAATVGIVDETRAAAAMHDAVRTPQLSEGLGSTCPSTPARR